MKDLRDDNLSWTTSFRRPIRCVGYFNRKSYNFLADVSSVELCASLSDHFW